MEIQVTYEQVVERLAPCGIDCDRCVRYENGKVKNLATALARALEGFENMAPRVADHFPALQHYTDFTEVLELLAGGVPAPVVAVGAATSRSVPRGPVSERQGVDFCFQCAEYPCERNAYPQNLVERWRAYNDRMRDVGVERYYQESLEKPRY